MKAQKRIQSITIKRMLDTDPDTSWLGEYSNKPNSDYSIDRAHSEDCNSIVYSREGGEMLDNIGAYVDKQLQKQEEDTERGKMYMEDLREVSDILYRIADDFEDCDCGHGELPGREYRYFNPNHENYKGLEEAEIRQNCKQDYERMEALNNQQWCFLGIEAEAEIVVSGRCQTITSGGLWGIESDSDKSYFTEIEQEQLGELKDQLKALGFSARAIATALKNVQHDNE